MSLSAVSNTAVLTLRARAAESRRRERLFHDPIAEQWSAKLPWPRELDRWYSDFLQAKTAIRAHQMDLLVQGLLEKMPTSTLVVELGCGFSTRSQRIGHARWLCLDLPPVIKTRVGLGDVTPSIEGSVLDTSWIERVEEEPNLILVAEGLLYYLPRSEVDGLFHSLRTRLEGSIMILDVIGQRDLKRSFVASSRAGAPILWSVEPPFEAAQRAFGLEQLPGLELDKVMHQTIEGFGRYFGPYFVTLLRGVARIPVLKGSRSGIMVGRIVSP